MRILASLITNLVLPLPPSYLVGRAGGELTETGVTWENACIEKTVEQAQEDGKIPPPKPSPSPTKKGKGE